ncbi:hypothetical protein HMF8227_00727 [Saliniradius amylolyticus]|uniref:Sulfotransferase domain-containing protein n=1 Tax=Saliniradius amylolyticus TaxID=2183582 RepID=A0A2S2E0S9_9ALTE|nr:hypothetical protein [Saliniradius amylolyticus]AWL11223.1 hypothetical protein HMF8227_00727 [Saliniradius amylolyticus]
MEEHEVILHIGMPKTGTTSLQNFLRDNRDSLEHVGVYLPKSGTDSSGACWPLVYELNRELGGGFVLDNGDALSNGHLDSVKNEIMSLDSAKRIVFSCEDLYYYSADYISNFLRRIFGYMPKVRVYFVIRDLVDYVDSSLNQVVKDYPGRWVDLKKSFNNVVNEKLDLTYHLSKFRAIKEVDSIFVGCYEVVCQEKHGVIASFLDFIGVDIPINIKSSYNANSRIKTYDAILIKNFINMLPLSLGEIRKYKSLLIEWEKSHLNDRGEKLLDFMKLNEKFHHFALSVYDRLRDEKYIDKDTYTLYVDNLKSATKKDDNDDKKRSLIPERFSDFLIFVESKEPRLYLLLLSSISDSVSSHFYNSILPQVREENMVGNQTYRPV